MYRVEQAIITLLKKFPEGITRSDIAVELDVLLYQISYTLTNLEKRGRLHKVGNNWILGTATIEEAFLKPQFRGLEEILKALETPKNVMELSDEVNMKVHQTEKILSSLKISGLVKRTDSYPPIWSLVNERDPLMFQCGCER